MPVNKPERPPALDAADRALVDGVLARRLRPLAKTITLIESQREDHQARARAVLDALLPHTGGAMRVGISGVPGVGKSTFIEALGLYLIGQGLRVAVLAVDPSSSVSGGSILGDKTRMEMLSQNPAAFIRPSPSACSLGGVAEKTRETMLVCEAAGFDVIIIETVGVGQSETAVAGMADIFCLLQLPNAGDDLQGIKKGIMELADLVVVNKADLDPAAATRAQAQLKTALHMLRPASREIPSRGNLTRPWRTAAPLQPLPATVAHRQLHRATTGARRARARRVGGEWRDGHRGRRGRRHGAEGRADRPRARRDRRVHGGDDDGVPHRPPVAARRPRAR